MIKGFVSKSSFLDPQDDGSLKTKNKVDFIECETFIEAETRLNEELPEITSYSFNIDDLTRKNYDSIIHFEGDKDEYDFHNWYEIVCKVEYLDEMSGKPKYYNELYLIETTSNCRAINILNHYLDGRNDYEIVSTKVTKIEDIYYLKNH